MALLRTIASQVLADREIPQFILDTSKTLISDGLVCTLAGAKTEQAEAMRHYLESKRERYGGLTDEDLALGLGFSAHALDFDNSSNYIGHNSAVLVPTALAISRRQPISGADLIRAYALATEVSFQIALQAVPDLNFRGFHITPVFGVIGATVEAGLLLGLDEDQLVNAMSLAISQSAGLMGQFGTMGKYAHCGLAASSAIRACDLALAGVRASEEILEASNGFYRAYAGKEEPAPITIGGAEAKNWAMGEFSFLVKMYPCCSAAHAAIEGMRILTSEHSLTPDSIQEIVVEVPEYSVHNLQYSHPTTEGEARFSMGFALANILRHGRYDLDSFSEENINDPVIRSLEDRIRMDVSGAFPAFVEEEPSILHVHLTDGTELTRECRYPLGRTIETPATADDLRRKAHGCLARLEGPDAVDRLIDELSRLEDIPSLTDLPLLPTL